MFIKTLFTAPLYFVAVVLIVTFSVCCHELCHAYVALKCGDSTAADRGYLTLNPLKQMGLMSIIMLLLLGISWGAVPIDPRRLTRKKRILVSLAGPFCNVLLFVLSMIFGVAGYYFGSVLVKEFFLFAAIINFVLFCVNIAPVPGLDGGNIVIDLLGKSVLESSELAKGFMLGAFLLLFYCIDYIYDLAAWVIAFLLVLCGVA